MGWKKRKILNQEKMILCILKNQIVLMEATQKQLETLEHTAKYGSDYINKLQKRIDETRKIKIGGGCIDG